MKRQMPAKILFLSGHLLYWGPWNHLKPSETRVSAIGTFGTIWNSPLGHLEQSLRLYLERALAQLELPEGPLEPSETI